MGILFNQNWPKSSRAWFLCHFNESPASNTRCESCKYSVKCWSMLKPALQQILQQDSAQVLSKPMTKILAGCNRRGCFFCIFKYIGSLHHFGLPSLWTSLYTTAFLSESISIIPTWLVVYQTPPIKLMVIPTKASGCWNWESLKRTMPWTRQIIEATLQITMVSVALLLLHPIRKKDEERKG